MDNNTETHPDRDTDGHADREAGVAARYERAVRGFHTPKPQSLGKPFAGITNEAKKERQATIEACVRLGMSVEQMVDFLPTLGVTLSRSQVYEYLGRMKLPRFYKPSEAAQSHHDYYTFRFFVRMAQDAAQSGYATHHLAKGKAPAEGARFRPDFAFSVRRYRFYMELQLSDLTETRWTVKMRNYLRLRREQGRPFRALFVIDAKGDLAYARRFARQLVERQDVGTGIFLFIRLDELKGSKNVATDPVWQDPWGRPQSLLQFLPLPGQKPSVPLQR
jgi:hypothetical protein